MDQIPGAPPQKKSGNKWLIILPCGCLTLLGLVAAGVAAIFFFVFGMLKNNEVYKDALARAKESAAVQEAIGTPIKESFLVTGSFNIENSNGEANLGIPITGPKGSATINVEARMASGKWTTNKMEVVVEGKDEPINLLE